MTSETHFSASLLSFPENSPLACVIFPWDTWIIGLQKWPHEGSTFASAWSSGFHSLTSFLGLPASCEKSKFRICAHALHNPMIRLCRLPDKPLSKRDPGEWQASLVLIQANWQNFGPCFPSPL